MTTNVKKAFVELVELLEANSNKKVSTLMPQILELVSSKSQSKTFHKDEKGEVVAIYCYYHKCWELVSEVEYGKKASTAHGFNTMCKEGVSQWTKQQRKAKQAKEQALEAIAKGELQGEDLPSLLQEIEEARGEVIAPSDSHGHFDSLEAALAF